jgi:hypothetical protein
MSNHNFCDTWDSLLNGLGLQVWSGPLSSGQVALVLWNKSSKSANITASWSDLGIENGTPVTIRDLWKVRLLHYYALNPKVFRRNFVSVMTSFSHFKPC